MKRTRGILLITLAMAGILALTACGKNENNNGGESGLSKVDGTPANTDGGDIEGTDGYFSAEYNEYFVNGVTYALDGSTKTAKATGLYVTDNTDYIMPDIIKYEDVTYKVTGADDSLFAYSTDMTSIRISKYMTAIPNEFLYDCEKLTSIIIPEGVTTVGDNAFTYCSMATEISLPSTLTSIGAEAFFGCEMLQTIVIPEGVTELGEGAFFDCSLLRSLTLPKSLKMLPDEALNNCVCLESITLPEGMNIIGYEVFWGCAGLKTVVIPDSVVSIGSRVFYDCEALEEVTLPKNLAEVDGDMFAFCDSLKKVYASEAVAEMLKEAYPAAEFEIIVQ